MEDREAAPDIHVIPLDLPVAVETLRRFTPLTVNVREARLTLERPWIRTLGKLDMEVRTEGWKFPAPLDHQSTPVPPRPPRVQTAVAKPARKNVRLQPTPDTVLFKDRLLYLLQPSLEALFAGKQVRLPFEPYPYQMEGIAFLMPRHAALLADEMGLGKTMQAIISLRLLFQAGLIRRALLVCPKPLVPNWSKELRTWADDLPFEIIGGDTASRRSAWLVSNCPLKLINYEMLTRDADLVADDKVHFDVVVLDEAQRIKNRDAKTSQVVRGIRRSRSWALTGTPVENRADDLINLFAFVDSDRVPPETTIKQLPALTGDCILRRTTEQVLSDLPPKTVRDAYVELSPAQRVAYELAEKEGVIHLNELGDTISVHHVFELVMRLKQICNFDPLTGESSKLERLQADLAEVAASGKKSIIFSQWVEPLLYLAEALREFGPLQYHGKVPAARRQATLEEFRQDKRKRVLLMSYGTGSVGLNLQFTNYVFLFDRWWNPAVEDQAIKRAHRIGQKEPVFVTRFLVPDTIEARIAEVLERKRQMFYDLIEQNGAPPALGLSEEEIFGLFDIRQRPTGRKAA